VKAREARRALHRAAAATLLAAAPFAAAPRAAGEAPAPTWSADVAPILHRSCAACHHPGGAGPFPLLTYEDARRHAPLVAHVTTARYMPPWLPAEGDFPLLGERRLSAGEIDTLARWAAAGAPPGDLDAAPPPPATAAGWQLGEPDLVVALDEPFVVPEDAPADVFRNFVLPLPVDGERWVAAVELLPGNARVVHHAVMQVDETRASRRRDAAEPGPGFGGMEMGESHLADGHLLGWTPGRTAAPGRPGMAWRLAPGTDLVLQLHMVPTGKPEAVRPRVGLYFAERPASVDTFTVTLGHQEIDIPAGAAEHRVVDELRLPVPVELHAVYPHAHYLGKRLRATATLPDGSARTLLDIPRWSFDWQDEYRFAPGATLPAGTLLTMDYTYDNSADNPRNPHQPPRRVRFGYRSSDEMGYLSLQVIVADAAALLAVQEAEVAHRLETSPGSWRAHELMGQVRSEQGRWQEAAEHLGRAVEAAPAQPAPRLALGRALRWLGRDDEALAHLRRAVDLDPERPAALSALGLALEARGELPAAIELFRRAVAAEPRSAPSRVDLAMALAAASEGAEAERQLREALELAPGDAAALYGLGRLAEARGDGAAATAHYREALDADPEHVNAAFALGQSLLAAGRPREAVEALRRAAALAPEAPRARLALAEALAAAGDPAAAEAELSRAAELAPDDPGVARARARLAQNAGRWDEAAALYARSLAAHPDDHSARYNRAVSLVLAGRVEEALPELRRALTAEPRYRGPLAEMARALAGHADPTVRRPDAAAALERLLAEAPGGSG
jgi:tetratricopeptide (TPR) repeat protein